MSERRDEHGNGHGDWAARPDRPTRQGRDEARTREADAILKRLRQETDPQTGAGGGRLLTHTLDHLAARDADQGDGTELMGTRIGRILALAVFVLLAMSLASQLIHR